ncbi:MAG: orotidine 5'-phosphate decarboxylase, partial [Butyrivibrio sp.]|nr:orotidine 5'-phosphate decarboxylase [Butyrivibrio sp.]
MVSRLVDKIVDTGAPIVVGLDPKLDFIPDSIKKRCFEEKGENLEGAAEAFWQYNKEIIDNIYDIVPAVKPQIAMYEELG